MITTRCGAGKLWSRWQIDQHTEVSHLAAVAVRSNALVVSRQPCPAVRVVGTNRKRQSRSVMRDGHVDTPSSVRNWTAATKFVPPDRHRRTVITGSRTVKLSKRFVITEVHALRYVCYPRPFCNNRLSNMLV